MNTRREEDHGEYWADTDGPVLSFDVKKLFNWIRGKMKSLLSLFVILFLTSLAYGQDCYTPAHNMAGYSEDLTSATGWVKVATMADVTTTIPPPRVYGVTKSFSATLAAGQSTIEYGAGTNISMVNAAPYILSGYAKYSTRQFIGLGLVGGATRGCSYDIQTGVAGACSAGFSTPTIASAGDGWYKLTALFTGDYATFPNARLGFTNQTNISTFTVLAATGGEVVYLSSPQIQNVVTGMSIRERSKYVPNLLLGITWAPALHCDFDFLTRPHEIRTEAQIAAGMQ